MKKEYLKLLRKLKKSIKNTENSSEKKLMLLAIDTYIETIKSDKITDQDIEFYLKKELKLC